MVVRDYCWECHLWSSHMYIKLFGHQKLVKFLHSQTNLCANRLLIVLIISTGYHDERWHHCWACSVWEITCSVVFYQTWWNGELSSHCLKKNSLCILNSNWLMRQHAVHSNCMCLIKSGFKQVLYMHLSVDMCLITKVYGMTLAINKEDGCGISNTVCHECLTKKTSHCHTNHRRRCNCLAAAARHT